MSGAAEWRFGMKKIWKNADRKKQGRFLFFSIVLVFGIIGVFVGAVSRKISSEMSESAIQNLRESLELMDCRLTPVTRRNMSENIKKIKQW